MSTKQDALLGGNLKTSLRFRPRGGTKRTERRSAERWQATIELWASHTWALFKHYAAHAIIVLIALVALSVHSFELPIKTNASFVLNAPTIDLAPEYPSLVMVQQQALGRGGEGHVPAEELVTTPKKQPIVPTTRLQTLMSNDLLRSPVVHTTIPKRLRREVITYLVERGDTVGGIAVKFGLEAETVMWANGNLAQNPDLLRPGQELVILPIDGVYHTVVKGDTLESLAEHYKAEVQSIIDCPYNGLDAENVSISPGDKLIVPGGIKPYVPRSVSVYKGPIPANAERGTGVFVWPATGTLTDRFGFRTKSGRWHNGLDIASPRGSPVVAADSGFVTFAGWTDVGYGNLVVIDHRNGYETRYAHLQAFFVTAGQSVAQGTQIGAIGTTGNSSGPHVHFEIRHKGVRKNPEMYLP
jgi:murein DD-endopeptidase MepM/ murein hydrolase activator NlpD